jgi:NAD(P)-dependent dehydrogenase (short-subunit alcohol dehydrogenase family)
MKIADVGVLITGGSRGLGAALGSELARLGAKVVLVARNPDALDVTVRAIRAAGGTAFALAGDVADKQAVHALAATASELAGPIRVLVHNASSLGPLPMRELLDTPCEELQAVLETNLIGPFRLTKVFAGPMILAGVGLVVHISSDAAVSAYPGWGAYGVSKAALYHLARIWAEELRDSGVHFLTIDPGEMNTRMHADAMPDADPATLADPAQVAKQIARTIETQELFETGSRIGAPEVIPI